ncbi:MAG TPA: hypothetical protein VLU47_03685 [Blastocatellia bacterium]|nr:hypothetical protein [Blastocatellia bacterium]
MKRRLFGSLVVFIIGFWFCLLQSRSVLSQGMFTPGSKRLPISSNESLALLALRHLAEAEYTFMSTIGKGRDFGTLQELAGAQLIDVELASGSKRGYAYKLSAVRATRAVPSSFEVIARPLEFGTTGVRSFHMDYRIVIRDSYLRNARVSDMRPIVHACGNIECSEAAAVSNMRLLVTLEAAYQSTSGRGRLFGTLRQLKDSLLIDEVLGEGLKEGYLFRIRTDPGSSTEAPSFEDRAIPLEYGVTGRWSFYVDETYVLRGDDKGGDEANSNDPVYSRVK